MPVVVALAVDQILELKVAPVAQVVVVTERNILVALLLAALLV
jgi:hypothetical protein